MTDSADFIARRKRVLDAPGVVVAFHMRNWKRDFLSHFFPHKHFHFADFHLSEPGFRKHVLPVLASRDKPLVFVWSQNLPDFAARAIRDLGLDVYFIEDGFVRSMAGHASRSAPFSLTLDRQRAYFDCRGPSDLEDLLNTYDFDADPALLTRARQAIAAVLAGRLTKYNAPDASAAPSPPESGSAQRRILVIGQVEEDASIRFGCDRPVSNNDLVRLAASENPGAEILYKPHPDVLNGVRRHLSDPAEVAHLCTILRGQVPLPDALEMADHVYTITSLSGFEALMRGKPVTVMGAPFYAGWGLTDDRQPMPRRNRALSVEAVFAAAYLLYPLYFDPDTGEATTLEAVLERVASRRPVTATFRAARAEWQPFGPYGILGWRHMLTPLLAPIIARVGEQEDAALYRSNPARFFRDKDDRRFRIIGRLLYPW